MHPSGNAWMFHFTHAYSMTTGHIGLDILTSTSVPFAEFNPERYKRSAGRPGTGDRDPRAGRRADEVETAGESAGRHFPFAT